jgi:REP element-mobilizing transposase RayT
VPQSLSQVYLHLVFSTKGRAPLLIDAVRGELHRYMAGVLKNLGWHAVLVNSMEEHVHILLTLSRTVSVSAMVEEIKTSSSKWLKKQAGMPRDFSWQSGSGVFSVSASNLLDVEKYIAGQQEHHRRRTFQEEFLLLLKKYGVEYDERYLWDG